MKTRSALVVLLVSAPLALFGIVGVALADPPSMYLNPPNHRHFLQNANGTLTPVGPVICGNPSAQQAFNQFHYNIHHSHFPNITTPDPLDQVVVPTLGPQEGAPGLHNGQGGEIIGIGGCG